MFFPFNSLVDDDDFGGVITNTQIHIQQLYSSIFFNHFGINENYEFDVLYYLDLDENYFNNVIRMFGNGCQCYDEKTLKFH